jgi:hypothetical protein
MRERINSQVVWKHTLEQYHTSRTQIKKKIIDFIASFCFCAKNQLVFEIFYPADGVLGGPNDKTDVRILVEHFLIFIDHRYCHHGTVGSQE